MLREKIKICVMRVGGTNRDSEAAECLEDQGVVVETLHLNDILRRRNLRSYHGLVLPGGFAYGDYVRAGAIWAKRIQAFLGEDIKMFAEAKKPILGICNGFQVLVEAGLLPDLNFSDSPKLSLAGNTSGKFECRWVTLKKNVNSNCVFTTHLNNLVRFPVAHGEGRFVAANASLLDELFQNNQVVLQYAGNDGMPAERKYPENPNGSQRDIAGICNPSGTVFGLMPHPEDAYWGFQTPDWTEKQEMPEHGDGYGIFRAMVDYIEQTL